MGVHYDYFRAADDESARQVGSVLGGPAVIGARGVVETKWVEPVVRVGRLFARVTGADWSPRLMTLTQVSPDEPIGPDNWDTPVVQRLDERVRDALAGVPPPDRDELGQWWSQTEEFVLDRADPAVVAGVCDALLELCRDAAGNDDSVYVWTSF
jgi:hypothetical protein